MAKVSFAWQPENSKIDFVGTGRTLQIKDINDAAKELECEPEALRAVIDVESAGGGFLSDKRPKILFESRWFSRLTDGKYNKKYRDISTARWKRNYLGGKKEYRRLQKAMGLNEKAALQSASWGLFQVLGVNFRLVGYVTIYDFIKDQIKSESSQFRAFIGFIKAKRLSDELVEHRWADFARVYNGSLYYKHDYDGKIERAYNKHKAQNKK